MNMKKLIEEKKHIINNGFKRILITFVIAIVTIATFLYANKKQETSNISKITDPEILRALSYGELTDEDIKVSGCENIEFSAFFIKDSNNDGYAEKYRGTCKSIGSSDELYINLKVLSGGKLENGRIEVTGSNFNYSLNMIKDSVLKYNYISDNVKSIELNDLDSGTQKLIIGDIFSNIGTDINNYNRNDNTITLTGTYVSADGSKIQVNETRNITVDWYGKTSTNIVTTDLDFDYSGLKNNHINFELEVNETAKQLLLQETGIILNIPELAGYAPTSVKCTNSNVETNYNEETRALTIKSASICNEYGIITSMISRNNTYSIAIEYPNKAYNAVSEGSIIYIPVSAYYTGYNNSNSEFANPYTSIAEKNISLVLKKNATGEIYNIFVDYLDKKHVNKPYSRYVVSKQNIIDAYNSENMDNIKFTVQWMAVRGYDGIVNSIKINETKNSEKYGDIWGRNIMDDYISNTGIYFSNASNMLGNDGKILIYDNDTNELIETFTSEDWNTYSSTNPYMYLAPIKHIRVETTSTNLNSTLYVYNVKEIDIKSLTNDFTQEEIKNIDNIGTYVTGTFDVEGLGEKVVDNIDYVEFVSQKSYATLSTSQNKLSTQENIKNQKIYINATTQEQYDAAWTNGQFILKIPEEIINMNVNNISINNSSVQIVGHTLYQKDNNYYIKIITQNKKETTYTITIDCDMILNPRTATTTNNLQLWYYNGLVNDYYYTSKDYYDVNSNNETSDNVGYTSLQYKFLAPSGVITFETVTDYNDEKDETIAPNIAEIEKDLRQAKINVEFINNYTTTISNIELLGKIPFQGNKFTVNQSDMNSQFTTTMTDTGIEIPSEIKNYTKIYYSENENPNKDINDESNGWQLAENITNFSNIKTYLIQINSYKINTGKAYKFTYTVNIPENLEYNLVSYSSHAMYYELNTSEGSLKEYTEPSKVGIKVARKYNFDVYKYKQGTTRPVAESTYQLIGVNDLNEIIDSKLVTSTTNGSMNLEGLYVDLTYTFKEIKASENYKINDDEIKFKVTENEQKELILTIVSEDNFANTAILEKNENERETLKAKVEDEPKYEIIINYKDSSNSEIISDVIANIIENGKIYKTDKNGVMTIQGLEQNSEYTLNQIRADGYYLSDDIKFKLLKDSEGNFKVESENLNFANAKIEDSENQDLIKVYVNLTNEKIPSYNLEIIKVEEKTNKTLSGAKFKLTSTDLKSTTYHTTNNEGKIPLTELLQYVDGKNITGEYILQEVTAPNGYCLNKEIIKFRAIQNADGNIELEIENQENLTTIQETKFEENTVKITLKNKPLFKLVKKDSETGELLANAQFIIYELDENNKVLDYAKDANGNYIAESTNYTVTTDEKGEITLPLRAGKYKAIEVGYPENYEEKGGTEYFEVEDTNNEESEENETETETFEYDENLAADETFEINYIEDLLKEYKNSDGRSDVVLKLQRTLDFNEDDSYFNKDDESFGDLNGDNQIDGIKEELTKKAGTGMPAIKISCGEFNGQGNEIRNLYINSSSSNVGLFDATGMIIIKNLGITGEINATYEETNSETNYIIGVFSSDDNGVITNCYNKANINVNINETNAENSAKFYIGGIIGHGQLNLIKNTYNKGNITVTGTTSTKVVGGIAGIANVAKIEDTYNSGIIDVYKNSESNVGGIIGNPQQSTIKNSYNIGNITGNEEGTFGPIVGINNGTKINCFYSDSIELKGGYIHLSGTAKSDEYMKSDEFVEELGFYWNRDNNENNGYPILNKNYEGIVINYIEDLVDLSIDTTNLSSGTNYYYRTPIKLNRTLNFEDDSSYKNFKNKDYGDLNQNDEIEELKTELTNKNGIGFTPIGGYYFSPIIDGQGYEIQNIYINSKKDNVALIGYMSKGEIKNLGITGEIKSESASNVAAIVAELGTGYPGGYATYGNSIIENCYNKANISGDGWHIGGIVAFANPYLSDNFIRIKNCYNEGNIIADNANGVGGIAGYLGYETGYNEKSGVIKSYNKGKITLNNVTYSVEVGGITGRTTSNILECYNEGNIEADDESSSLYIGGLSGVAYINTYLYPSNIYKSYNIGEISIKNGKNLFIGGLIGRSTGNIKFLGSYNKGKITVDKYEDLHAGGLIGDSYYYGAIIDNCYNEGNIEAKEGNSVSIGGIFGYLEGYSGDLQYKAINTYNSGNITILNNSGTAYVGGIYGNVSNVGSYLYNKGNIEVNSKGQTYVGGIWGYRQDNDTATNCYNHGNINIVSNSSVTVGGIVSFYQSYNSENVFNELCNTGNINVFNSSTSSTYMGGVLGNAGHNITNSYNTGNLNLICNGEAYVSGISAMNRGLSVSQSYNEGNINVSNLSKATYIGGISNIATVNTSYNSGNIYFENLNNAYARIGGILGEAGGFTSTDCYNEGNIKVIEDEGNEACVVGGIVGGDGVSIINTYSTGDIDANNCGTHIQGGYINIANSYYSENIQLNCIKIPGDPSAEVYQFVSEEYMKSEEFYNTLNTNNVWVRAIDNYPKLNISAPTNISKLTEIEIENIIKKYEITVNNVKDEDEIGGTVEGNSETVKIGGSNQNEFKFIPDADYEIEYVRINGINQELSLDENRAYTIKQGDIYNIQEDKHITVKFKQLDNLTIKKVDSDDENIKLQGSKFEIQRNLNGNDLIGEITNGTSYQMVQIENTYISNNKNIGSSSACTRFTIDLTDIKGSTQIKLDAEVSSEENGDYGFAVVTTYGQSSATANTWKTSNFCYISGTQSKKTYLTTVEGGSIYYLYIGYTKNESGDAGNDQFIVSNIQINLPKITVTTDSNGIATARIENDKSYTITEVKPPIGYETSESSQEVIITDKEFKQITFKNKKLTDNFTITKVDSDDENIKLSGAEFEIRSIQDIDADETVFLAYSEKSEYSEDLNTWNDMLRRNYSAKLNSGTAALADDESLYFDGSTTWTINDWQEGSYGTYEIEVAVDKDFQPVNTTYWYQASCILGCELPYTQKDFGIIINKSGKFALGYDNSTIYSSNINALDGNYHKIAFVYSSNKLAFYIDGNLITTIYYSATGNQITKIGIGWNADLTSTAIKGKIRKVKIYKTELNQEQIKANANNEIYLIDKVTTNNDGIIQTCLNKGKYILTETVAPKGYELNSEPITIIKEDNDISITIENNAITHKITSKVEGHGGVIEGEDEIVKKYKDSKNDIIVKPNTGYKIEYIKINGEKLELDNDTTESILLDKFTYVEQDIEIIAKFTIKDDYNFVLNKLDNITEEPLEKVKFEILDENGNYATDYWGEIIGKKERIDGEEKYVVTTDEKGQIKLKLKTGRYKAVEVKNLFDFMLEEKEFEITNENIEYELSWTATSISNTNPIKDHIIGTKDGGMLAYVINKTIPKEDVVSGEEIRVEYNEMCIAKYNKFGKVENYIKTNTQYPIYSFDDMYEDNDGNYIIVGSAFKMDFTADQTAYNKETTLIEYVGPPRFFVLKLNKDLKLIWGIQSDDFYTDGNTGYLGYITQNKDNYYNIGVTVKSLSSSTTVGANQTVDNQEINVPLEGQNNLVIKCNLEGKIKSINKASSGLITKIEENSDGTYTAVDGTNVFKYDSNLNLLGVGALIPFCEYNDTVKLADGGFLRSGKNVSADMTIPEDLTESGESMQVIVKDTPTAVLAKYSQNEKIEWIKSYDFSADSNDSESILYIKQTSNKNYIGIASVGSTYKLAKFDENYNLVSTIDLPNLTSPYLYTNKDNTQIIVYNNEYLYSYKFGNNNSETKQINITNQKESIVNIHYYLKPTDTENENNPTKIAEDEQVKGKLGDEYTINPKLSLNGYTLAVDENGEYIIPDNAYGTFSENNEDVNYYYEKQKVKLTIHYYLQGTENKIQEDKVEDYEIGSTYNIDITNHTPEHYIYVSSSADLENVIEENTEISLYYKKEQYKITTKVAEIEGSIEKGGTISGEDQEVYEYVEYGNIISSEIVASPTSSYRLKSLTINGNTAEYVKTSDGNTKLNEQNPVTEDLEVVAQFEKNTGKVIVYHYLENTTQPVRDNTIYIKEIGQTVEIEPEEIEGYALVESPENEQIEVTEEVQEIVYYYQQKMNVTTNIIEHTEKYKDGTIIENQKGGTISGEDETPYEEILKGRTNQKEIEIKPNDGYKIIKVTINSETYDYTNKLDEEGNLVIQAGELGKVETDQQIEVEFRKKTKLYVKHIDKDTGESLLNESEYEEFELYESQIISISQKAFINYQNAIPDLTDEFNKEINNELTMFADEYTVTYWYERIPSGIIEKHIEIDELGRIMQIEMNKIDGKAGLTTTINRKLYDKYIPLDAPEVTYTNVITTSKDENSVDVTYSPDEVREVWFYYERECTVSTQIKEHEGTLPSEEGEIYQIVNKEDGTQEKVNSETVLRGGNAQNNIKIVPNKWYRIKSITLKKIIYNEPEENNENEDSIQANDIIQQNENITSNLSQENNNENDSTESDANSNTVLEGTVIEENLKISDFIQENGEAIITTDSPYLQKIDGDYIFTVEFERIPAKINIEYIDIDTKESIPNMNAGIINLFFGDNVYKIIEQAKKDIENYEQRAQYPEIIPEIMEQESLTIKYYYKRKFKITATSNDPNAGTVEFKDGSKEEVVYRGNENTKQIIIKANFGYKLQSIKVNNEPVEIQEFEQNEDTVIIKEGYFKNIQSDKSVVAEFIKIPAKVKVQYIEEASNKVIFKTDDGKEYDEINGYVNDVYETEAKTIKNYEILNDKLPENAKGKMQEEEIVVTYYYKKSDLNMKVEKEITKVKVNKEEFTQFENNKLVTTNIKYKDINDISIKVTYNIKVTNIEKAYGATIIKETLPDGMEFIPSESNSKWKYENEEYILQTDELAPEETKNYSITLLWNCSEDNAGKKINMVELKEVTNDDEFEEAILTDNKDEAILEVKLEKINEPESSQDMPLEDSIEKIYPSIKAADVEVILAIEFIVFSIGTILVVLIKQEFK